MNSIFPTLSEALRLHDVAHELNDDELHKLAVKMLAMNWQPHIATEEGESETAINPAWDELPPVLRIADEVACVTGAILHDKAGSMQLIVGEEIKEKIEQTPKMPKNVKIVVDSDIASRVRVPAYEMYLIKKDKPEFIYPESGITPGEPLELGYFRKHGAYKFPVVVQKLPDSYSLLQIHKGGDEIVMLSQDGATVIRQHALEDLLRALDIPGSAVFAGVFDEREARLLMYDLLYFDDRCLLSMPLVERLSLLSDIKFEGNIAFDEYVIASSPEELLDLDANMYLVRYKDEIIDDLKRPFWFVYTAGDIRVGQPVPAVSPAEGTIPTEDCMKLELPEGVHGQIHKNGNDVKIFLGDGGRNRDVEFDDICAEARQYKGDFIIECVMLVEDEMGNTIDASRIFNADVSSANTTAFCYDILYLDGKNICNKTYSDRYGSLCSVAKAIGDERSDLRVATCGGNDLLDKSVEEWYFVKDSMRQIGEKVNDGWFVA